MSAILLGLLAESHVHPGTGQADGTVDLPVAREKPTGYPFVPGSSGKGAIKEAALARGKKEAANGWFGQQENAGAVMVSDARLLLLPVRSLTGAYRWLTCPYLVERFVRDRHRGKPSVAKRVFSFDALTSAGDAAAASPPVMAGGTGRLFLEERTFTIAAPPPDGLLELLGETIADDQARRRLKDQLAVVSDDDFGWFARFGLSIQARNCLQSDERDGDKANPKTSTNLWYEETLPPDTVMYLLLADRFGDSGAAREVAGLFGEAPYLQLGGNETVGQGWFLVRTLEGEG